MKHLIDDPTLVVNFCAILKKDGKEVDRRVVHNVFTDIGRDWMAHLVAWHSLGDPDVPVTQRRVRWIGVGAGVSQAETASVVQIESPVPIDDAGTYLAALDSTSFPSSTVPTTRFTKEFGAGEISTAANPVVPLTEAALFVDVHRVQEIGGEDDAPYGEGGPGELSTTLSPAVSNNPPVAYARFETLSKTSDFILEIRWDFRFP